MNYLTFQIQAPLSAWGETAVGEYRPTANYPSRSAITGLLAAALGVDREQEAVHQSLYENYPFAIGVQSTGRLLRDYHTAQVPGQSVLKKRPHRTRFDELNVPKEDLNTILSTRDYRQEAACLVALQASAAAPFSLADLSAALQKPKYVLYLGRKSCPLAAPLWPRIMEASDAFVAMQDYREQLRVKLQQFSSPQPAEILPIVQLIWCDGIQSGQEHDLKTVRKDRLLSRRQWQFGDRYEYIRTLGAQ